jgi:cell division septal protein FtsQ
MAGSRVERFKEHRKIKRKYLLAALILLLLLVMGILVSDYSVNYLLKDDKHVNIVGIKSVDEYQYEISFLDYRLYITTKYISRDYEKLRNLVSSFFNAR